MIKIKQIEIDSYKLFNATSLDLESVKGLITVEGKNNDIENFSSNSVGKTTMVNVLLHTLYGKNLNNECLEKVTNIYTKEKPSCTITFEKEGVEYVVKNNYQEGTVKIFADGVWVELTRKADNFKEIENILGISHFLMSNLIYISPTSPSLFSSAGNDNQSKFMQSLLNLEFIGSINKKASADLKTYRGEYNLAIKEVTIKRNQVEGLQKQLGLIPEVEKKDYAELINNLSGEVGQAEILRSSHKKVYDKLVAEKDKITRELIELKSELKHLKQALRKEEDLINKGTCPTCEQKTSDLEIKTDTSKIKQLEKDIKSLGEDEIKARAEVKEQEDEISKVASEIARLNAELKRVKKDKEAQDKQQSKEEVRNKLKEQLTEALEELVEVQQRVEDLEKKVYILELITESSSSRGFVKERIQLFLQLYNLELQKLAKELLGKEYAVEIVKSKSTFELTVDDGDCVLSYGQLSSGFKARLDILLVLALNKAVEVLTGISINVLVLDEILGAIDQEGVSTIEELLFKVQNKFPDKVIFLVSHNQYLRISDNTLVVERDGNTSKFKWK